MSAAFQAFETREQYTAGDLVSDNAIGIAANDLIIVDLHTNDSAILPSGLSDSLGNSYTALTQQTNSNANERTYWCVSAGAGAAVTFTGSFSTGSATKNINITTFRPSAAVTWTLESNTTGSSYGTAVSATAGSVVGSDMVAHTIVYTNATKTFSNQTVGGVSPDGIEISGGNADIFYKLYTSDTGSIAPADTLSSATQWVCRFLIFKATASAGGGTTYSVTASDGVVMSETVDETIAMAPSVSDGVTMADSPGATIAMPVSASDGISMADSSSASLILLAAVTDGITLSDAPSATLALNLTVADGATLFDAVSAAIDFVLSVSDGVEFADVSALPSDISGLVTVTVSAGWASVSITGSGPGASVPGSSAKGSIS